MPCRRGRLNAADGGDRVFSALIAGGLLHALIYIDAFSAEKFPVFRNFFSPDDIIYNNTVFP